MDKPGCMYMGMKQSAWEKQKMWETQQALRVCARHRMYVYVFTGSF